MAGAVFEWLSSNSHIEYPFIERQPAELHELFVDAYVIHSKHRTNTGRLRMESFNPAGTLSLKFEDSTLLAALTGADNFLSTIFGSYTLYEWRRSTTTGPGFTFEDIVARVVVLTSKLGSFSFPVVPLAAYLLPSVVNPRVKRVRRIGVALPELSCCLAISDKQVVLEAGNNMEVLAEADSEADDLGVVAEDVVRVPTTLILNATAGAGAGRFQTCTSLEPAIRRINKVGADPQGNFALAATDCLWPELRLDGPVSGPIRPNTDYLGTLMAALLQLHADCRACCDCPDYGTVYTNIKTIWDRALAASERIETLRQRYNNLCTNVGGLKTEREVGLKCHLRLVARPDFHLAISGLVSNNSANDIGAVTLRFILNRADAGLVAGSGLLDAENSHNTRIDPTGDPTAGYEITLPSLRAAHYAVYTFEVRASSSTPPRAGAAVRVDYAAEAGALSAEDTKTATLLKPLTKA
jgi:hypothetical protein